MGACYSLASGAASRPNFGSETPAEPKFSLKTEFWCNALGVLVSENFPSRQLGEYR
jgi:hypothetical protein